MKLITVTKNETDFELIIAESNGTTTPVTAINTTELTQEEINELAEKCDQYRTDKIHSYKIPYIGDEKLKP